MDVGSSAINTIVDISSVIESNGNVAFNFYVQVTTTDGTVYILNADDLLAAARVSLNSCKYSLKLCVENAHSKWINATNLYQRLVFQLLTSYGSHLALRDYGTGCCILNRAHSTMGVMCLWYE